MNFSSDLFRANSDTIVSTVSLAVWLVDDFSRTNRILGDVEVSLEDTQAKPIRNHSGFYVFTDLVSGSSVVRIRSKFYLEEDRPLDVPLADALNPLLSITLKPNRLYPFPSGVTLIRGRIKEENGNPLSGAQVTLFGLSGRQIKTRATNDGRFVLYITGLTEDDVTATSNGRVLITDSERFPFRFRLKTTHAGYRAKNTYIKDIREGKTLMLENPIILTNT
ncbi:MAG: carboxypeptidase-like regulatory domain-containing protein [Gammaproteobacteria bacterium]